MSAVENQINRLAQQKKEKPKIMKVSGAVPERKKNLWDKTVDVLFAEDFETAKDYVLKDVVKPYTRDFIVDVIVGFVHNLFYGTGSSKTRGSAGNKVRNLVGSAVNASYQPYYLNATQNKTPRTDLYTVKEIVMEDMAAAEDLVQTLSEYIAHYHQVTVNDLYDAIGYTGIQNDQWYGWKTLDGVTYKHVPGGVRVVLPKPIELN